MSKISFTTLISFGAVLGLLAACSTPSEVVNLSDNSRAFRITCGGPVSSTNDCYEKAGNICGNKGYSVVRETDIRPPEDSSYFWNAAAHEVLVKCNTPK